MVSKDCECCCVNTGPSLAQAFMPGAGGTVPVSLGPFRGSGSTTHAPKGAGTEKTGRFLRPRHKCLG